MNLHSVREEYRSQELDEAAVLTDPISQFEAWFRQAVTAGIREANAMALATASPGGDPSVRIVLLKGFDQNGFVFFTNYESAKARQLEANPRAEAAFFWKELERQVRIHGSVSRVSRDESAAYFATRPLPSRLGAWASPQSQPLRDRAELNARFEEAARRYPDGNVPLPEYWGGYCLQPQTIEFWQGRPSRLHDRVTYTRTTDGSWVRGRLAP